ncbi:NAD-P-binding protein [Hymenopellis radicata]|nr:NAD-P-binding protein [Hymenopellis radicata]
MSSQLVWFITGTTSGLGRELATAALARGEKVIATGRAKSLAHLDDLKALGADTLELDVTASQNDINAVAKKAVAIHGRIDVVVNNAGYAANGTLEENTPQQAQDQFNTNVFGALNVARAFLPYMRERKSGTIVWIGSYCGWTGTAFLGLYTASKFAIRGLSESLHLEIAPLGLRSICFDFGAFRTNFLSVGTFDRSGVSNIEEYQGLAADRKAQWDANDWNQPGDPQKGVNVVLEVVRGEGAATGRPVPSTMLVGLDSFNVVQEELKRVNAFQMEWSEVTKSTDL